MSKNDKYTVSSSLLFLVALFAVFAITGCWPQDPAAPTPVVTHTNPVVSETTEPDGTTVYTYEDGSTAGLIPPATPAHP